MTAWTGPLIRNLRLRLGWTQSELGRRLGLNLDAVVALESGHYSLDMELVYQLEYLKKYIDDISQSTRQRPQMEKLMKDIQVHQIDHSKLDDK